MEMMKMVEKAGEGFWGSLGFRGVKSREEREKEDK